MRRVLLICNVDFWKDSSGNRARISSLLIYLQEKFDITVIYYGTYDQTDEACVRQKFSKISVTVFYTPLSVNEYLYRFKSFIQQHQFDVAIVEYVDLAFVLPMLPPSIVTILDTHDIISERRKSLEHLNMPIFGIEVTEVDEFRLFDCFDYVMAIQQNDFKKISTVIGESKTLLTPHPVVANKIQIRQAATRIGYIGSNYGPSANALIWFLAAVWPTLASKEPVSLEVYGTVCKSIVDMKYAYPDRVNLNGFIVDKDEAYDKFDIVINPVKGGAGLKIKNVEALGRGVPLVTTSHGAVGMEEGIDHCFLIADDAHSFEIAICELIHNITLREQISEKAHHFAVRSFDVEKCFGPLRDVILIAKKPGQKKVTL